MPLDPKIGDLYVVEDPKPGILARWFPRHFHKVTVDDIAAVMSREWMTTSEFLSAIQTARRLPDFWRIWGSNLIETHLFLDSGERVGRLESTHVMRNGYQVKAYRLKET